jgi:hypothetical protein
MRINNRDFCNSLAKSTLDYLEQPSEMPTRLALVPLPRSGSAPSRGTGRKIHRTLNLAQGDELLSNISGLTDTTSFTDTNPPAGRPAFYRVSVQR